MPGSSRMPLLKSTVPEPAVMGPALLSDLVRWREALARSIARNNFGLRSDGIMTAVNRILFPLLLLRLLEDAGLLPEGSLQNLRNAAYSGDVIGYLCPCADALYADEHLSSASHPDFGVDFMVEEQVLAMVLDGITSPDRRYNLREMGAPALAQVLTQYLSQTVRRTAAHMATVVDAHDTVLSGTMTIPPSPLIHYLVREAVISARENRSSREVLPLRIFDPACGPGVLLVEVYHTLVEDAGGPALSFEEHRDILAHSVHGLDISRHAVAAARMILVIELFSSPHAGPGPSDILATIADVLHKLRHTVICGNALIRPDIERDEAWMFCPARSRQALNPFPYNERFPEIVAGGGFDCVICNPPEGRPEDHEWVRQYFQRRYASYHPQAPRSVYFFEKALGLVLPGGTVAMCMDAGWLRKQAGSPFRGQLIRTRIREIADLSSLPPDAPGAGLCLVRVQASRPDGKFVAVTGTEEFTRDPGTCAAGLRFPVVLQALDAGGWSLYDTRADAIVEKVRRAGTPLADVVMGQIHQGIHIANDTPFVIDAALAREWIRRDPRCRPLLRPVISAAGEGTEGKCLILIPAGWTRSHPGAAKRPWQWFRHRHPFIARHLQPHAGPLKERAGPEALWWETPCDEFWAVPRKKILFAPARCSPAFQYDAGRGIGDETMAAFPSSGLYLAGILTSRLMAFILDHTFGHPVAEPTSFFRNIPVQLPVYTPDLDQPEERAIHDRIAHLVGRRHALEKKIRDAPSDSQRDAVQNKINATRSTMNALVNKLYGLTPEEIAVVEGFPPS